MGIMFMRGYDAEDLEWDIASRKTSNNEIDNNDSPWTCAFVIVENTSLMAWTIL